MYRGDRMESTDKKQTMNIAIYTRKSNDENLNIEVTSIDNQKLCCKNYILSQKDKGWRVYPEQFDDPAQSLTDLQ